VFPWSFLSCPTSDHAHDANSVGQHISCDCMMHYLRWHWLKLCVGQYYCLMNMIKNGSYMTHYLRCPWFEKYVEPYCYQKGITLIMICTLYVVLKILYFFLICGCTFFMHVDRAGIILQCLKNKYTWMDSICLFDTLMLHFCFNARELQICRFFYYKIFLKKCK
jgi:hypothetical protein